MFLQILRKIKYRERIDRLLYRIYAIRLSSSHTIGLIFILPQAKIKIAFLLCYKNISRQGLG